MSRIRRRRFLIATGVLLATPLALAQQAANVPTIGYITNDAAAIDKARREAFKQGLRDLGYVEGQNYRFEARMGEGDSAKLPAMMQDLLRAKPAVIFAFTTPAILAARHGARLRQAGDPPHGRTHRRQPEAGAPLHHANHYRGRQQESFDCRRLHHRQTLPR